ncbi:MAG: hypothetical protein HFH93_06005 [Lachnospiraceae bacterium]|nr:hypothetical protein [Lachnospiraceae bacterium]
MMNDWKLGIKMMRYGYGIKTNCIVGGITVVLGIGAAVLGGISGNMFPADYMMLVVGMLPVQVLFSLNITGMVQASPGKKRLQTRIPALINFSVMTVVYLAEILISGIILLIQPQSREGMGKNLLLMAVLMAAIMLYTGVAYKYFIISSLCVVPVICIGLSGGIIGDSRLTDFLAIDISLGQAVAAGLALLIAGALGQYLISLLIYRAPLDKMGQVAPLRRLM